MSHFSLLAPQSTHRFYVACIQIANVLVMEDFTKRWPIVPLQKGIMSKELYLRAQTHT